MQHPRSCLTAFLDAVYSNAENSVTRFFTVQLGLAIYEGKTTMFSFKIENFWRLLLLIDTVIALVIIGLGYIFTDCQRCFEHIKKGRYNLYRPFYSPNWARTSDIMINSHALYRLSYRGISWQ